MAAPGAAALKHLKVSPKEAHKSTVIFLHGLGDSGHGWLPVAKQLWSHLPNTKWILPHAPSMPVSINGGYRMPSWYDIAPLEHLTDSKREDEAGVLETVAAIDRLIQAEVEAGIPENKVVVAGFSQGGAISAYLGLTTKRKLAGIGCLSTYVPVHHVFPEKLSPTAKELPMFWGHGTDDPVVQYKFCQQSIDLLKTLGFTLLPPGTAFARPGVKFESYRGMQHSSCPDELRDLLAWLKGALE